VDHRAEDGPEGALGLGRHLGHAERLGDGAPPLGARALAQVRRQVVEAEDLELAQVGGVVGVQVVDLDEAQVGHLGRARLGVAVGRVVPLHVGDLQQDAGPVSRRDHRLGLGDGRAHRLLDQDVLASLDRGDARRGVRAGGADDHGVDVGADQLAVVGEAPLGRDAVRGADGFEQAGREVAQAGDREVAIELTQVRQVLYLGDRAAADQADLEAGHGSLPRWGRKVAILYRLTFAS
jgi:hypothetical protein